MSIKKIHRALSYVIAFVMAMALIGCQTVQNDNTFHAEEKHEKLVESAITQETEMVLATDISQEEVAKEDALVTYTGPAGDVINDIRVGWNLGNALDSNGDWILLYTEGKPENFETAWGNPVTTEQMILDMKEVGYYTGMGIYNRYTNEWVAPQIAQAMTD